MAKLQDKPAAAKPAAKLPVPAAMKGVKAHPPAITKSGIARLRQLLNQPNELATDALCQEAAVEIERLRRDVGSAETQIRKLTASEQ